MPRNRNNGRLMRLPTVIGFLALVGCGPGAQSDGGSTGDTSTDSYVYNTETCPKTDTFPQFCNQVPKNLIFLSIDTFRKDHMGRYAPDGEASLTPNLDALAAEGVALDNNVQCSDWTFASTTCTLAGAYNTDRKFIPSLNSPQVVPLDKTHLAGWLRDYLGTWSVLGSSNGWLSPNWGNARDYDVIMFPAGPRVAAVGENVVSSLRTAQGNGNADRWFMHIHGLEPHAAYAPPEEYLEGLDELEPAPWDLTSQKAHYDATALWPSMTDEERTLLLQHLDVRYRGEVRLFDDGVGIAMDALEAEGLLDDTLVVVWSDHGEAFWEHGYQTHAYTLYGEENDTVAFFWSKNIVPAVVTQPTSSIDIVPTLMELYDIPQPPEVTGVPLSQRTEDRTRFGMVSARLGNVNMVIDDGWKLQFNWGGQLMLTNPGSDPTEMTDYDEEVETAKVQELWTLLEPKVQDAVEALGYEPVWPTF